MSSRSRENPPGSIPLKELLVSTGKDRIVAAIIILVIWILRLVPETANPTGSSRSLIDYGESGEIWK